MAITILDVDWADGTFGGKAPQVMFDFNPPKSENQTEKLHRIVAGRLTAVDGDTVTADEIGLRSIRAAVFTPNMTGETAAGGFVVSGSVGQPGSIDNTVTLVIKKNRGTAVLASASAIRLSYFAAGDI